MQPVEQVSELHFTYGDELIAFTLRQQPSRTVRSVAIHVEPRVCRILCKRTINRRRKPDCP